MPARRSLARIGALALLTLAATTVACADNGAFAVRDDWNPVDRLLIAVNKGDTQVSDIALEIIKRAKSKARIFVSDGDKTTQDLVIQDLIARGAIAKANDVTIIDNPSPSSFARDFSPFVRFDAKNAVNLTATQFDQLDQNANLARIGEAVKLPTTGVPTIAFPGQPAEKLYLDGGNWMTTDNGKTLITTTELYDQYSDMADAATVRKLVDAALKKEFGIEKVIALEPLKEKEGGYDLSNTHVDMQVRTLPGGKVMVASVPAGDVQAAVLDANAKVLTAAGYSVIRIANAPQVAGKTAFRSYTNTLFVNGLVLVPSYGNQQADDAAKGLYDKALNAPAPGNAPGYAIHQIDSSAGIECGGAVRCSAREISQSPSAKKGPEASSFKNPILSYDARSGELRITSGLINFLGTADGSRSTPGYLDDRLRGAVLSVEGMVLSRSMSDADRYAFVGGRVRLTKDGVDCLDASIPAFSVYGTVPNEALRAWGMMTDVMLGSCQDESAWIKAFDAEVLDSSSLLPDLFVDSATDLIAASNGFQADIAPVELDRMGIVGNGTPVSEPGMPALAATALLLMMVARRPRRQRKGRVPPHSRNPDRRFSGLAP